MPSDAVLNILFVVIMALVPIIVLAVAESRGW